MPYKAEDEGIMSPQQLMYMYRRASREGRLHPGLARELKLRTGDQRCKTCGMTAYTAEEAADCCTSADRWSGNQPGVIWIDHVATVLDQRQLLDALAGMKAMTCKSWEQLFPENGNRMRVFARRVRTGDSHHINSMTWDALVGLFGARVPGCAELGRTYKKREVA